MVYANLTFSALRIQRVGLEVIHTFINNLEMIDSNSVLAMCVGLVHEPISEHNPRNITNNNEIFNYFIE